MKESQLRQLIREEISKVMDEKENLSEMDPLMIQQAAELDLFTIGKILASLGLTIGGIMGAEKKLEDAAAKGNKKAQAVLDFFKGFTSGGGSGR